ncbi:probable E3 ubiquitin-protein ligase RHY1A [Solanum pennellii]|uniref:Probable E3 ubiquitin-protein ligase RHY1A n=1 Tax=Solanum pennellii TaxID=28526 RepID=A0ABM1G0K6_SOLPN|nr:probable E3 ubiquitin-protein ligase RHY1A [Solanum pennellii]XP_015064235.1 probable E3 ubiquitin-protein ligase RHY1A [Solanum pennellii]
MTSASELFFTRRSRYGRSDLELGSDLSTIRNSHNHSVRNRRHQHHNHQPTGNNTRRDRVDVNDCEPLRRSPPHRLRRLPPDRDSVSLDSANSQSASGDTNHATNNNNRIRDRVGISGSERLPGAVLLARERLLQRLRGVSISGNRRSYGVRTSSHRNNVTFEDDFGLADASDGEADSSLWLAGTTPSPDHLIWVRENKRPPGLSQEAMDLLHIGVYSNSDKEEARAVIDCSICLDAFLEGDKLVCLPCGHRYHPCCLEPWVRTCGDCPYCRAAIHV